MLRFLFGAFIFLTFLECDLHLRGIDFDQSDSSIQFYLEWEKFCAPKSSSLSLADFFGESSSESSKREKKYRPLKPSGGLFSMVTLEIAIPDIYEKINYTVYIEE